MTDAMYTSGRYLEQNPSWHVEDSAWKALQVERMLRRHDLRPQTVCEVGCGAGEVLRSLRERLPEQTRFVGYEISPDAFELAQARTTDRLEFRLANVLDDPAARFDVVLLIDVLEHMEDYFGFLRALRGRSPYTIVHFPLEISVQTVLRNRPLLVNRETVGHLHYFNKDLALRALTDTGYEVVDHFYSGGDLPARSRIGRVGNVMRRTLFPLNQDLTIRLLGGYSLLVLARAPVT
jgi:SAM-dependent methyltransferase